jgi:hypothetical protein
MYIPDEGEAGLSVLLPAMRDYLASDAQLMAMLPGAPEDVIIGEGHLDENAPDTVIMLVTIGDGLTESGEGTSLIRLIAYVISKGRGYYKIENIIPRLKTLFESEALWEALTFPPEAGFAVLGVRAPGTTASTTLPRYSSEMRGVYTFLTTVSAEGSTVPPPPPPPDTTAPTAPSSLAANPTSTTVTLSWSASTDNVGVDHYAVYEDGILLGNTSTPGYVVTGLSPETAYTYTVEAVDAAGNISAQASVDVTTDAAPIGGTFTFEPTTLASNIDVPGRFRGLGWWRGAPRYVPDVVTETEYQRFTWDQLEAFGTGINLAPLTSFVNGAVSRGRRAAFRVQAYVPEDTAKRVPSDIPTVVVNSAHIPVWDDPVFLPRLNALLAAIGAVYNGNPAIAYVDIGIYGRWGEWHMFGVTDYAATQATQNGIINAHCTHLGDCQLLMLTDNDVSLGYAMDVTTTARPIGLRRDSWGKETQFDDAMARPNWYKAADRWKTAPFVVEAYAASGFTFNTTEALAEVSTYHLSNAGNANIPGLYDNLPDADKARWREIQAALGYRFYTNLITYSPADTLSLEVVNSGNAPIYEATEAEFIIKDAGSLTVDSGPLVLDLEGLLPGATRSATAPAAALDPGTYSLFIRITYTATGTALGLAQSGGQEDGSYLIGEFTIS